MAQSLQSPSSSPEDKWSDIARTTWLKDRPVKRVKPEAVKNIWDLLESDTFDGRSLLALESLQVLERFLWPGYSEDASNYHVLLLAVIVNTKQRERLPIWDTFMDRPSDFANLFRRVLSMNLDHTLPTAHRIFLLTFVIGAFQSLEHGLIRKECAPLVSISIWHHLQHDGARDARLEKNPSLKKAWRASSKRYEAADDQTKSEMRFERSWLYSMLLDFLRRLNKVGTSRSENLSYCERFMEFLVDLDSQLPTRRYVNTLLQDLNLLPVIKLSEVCSGEGNALFRDFYSLLRHFVNFSIDDHLGLQKTPEAVYEAHCEALAQLQRTAIKHFKEKLTILALSNYAAIDQPGELEGHLAPLTDAELARMCDLLGFRISWPKTTDLIPDRALLLETLVSHFERRKSFQEMVGELTALPTENNLYDPAFLRNEAYDGSRPLAIPKLNLQYLSLGDFMWRSFLLYRSEAFFAIRKDMEAAIKRMQPRSGRDTQDVSFEGFSRMGLPIVKPAIIEVAPPKVGYEEPAFVRAEIALDISRLNESIRREWESLRPEDVVFLLAVRPPPLSNLLNNGHSGQTEFEARRFEHIRAAEVVQVLDENGRPLREQQSGHVNGYPGRPRRRRLLVNLDVNAYKHDQESVKAGRADIYNSFNVIVRRRGRENNFRSVLETMRNLTIADTNLPSWFQEVFLGYGDPAGARYTALANKVKSVDFRDTFLDWQHLIESFPGRTIEPAKEQASSFGPPYVLEPFAESEIAPLNPSKKRRRDQAEAVQSTATAIRVSTYKPANTGPFPTDAPKLNTVRFTPAQVEAIMSGTQPGLTVIVGPPGTGKTDVATQIINNIYHNFPNERTLLVAHSNQALNQLFQKIIALDIDERHLLRLGHGEEELETEASYSKFGRVESFLENRSRYLAEVDRLAASVGAQGAHGNSCETASYFNTVYIQPAWAKFWDLARSGDASSTDIVRHFPFYAYFASVLETIFTPDQSRDELLEVASGCEFHINKIFTELEDIRPFEILRLQRDKANYLLVKEARIIAMTSTHAAMRRQEIADLGFHYDSVVMEEAAQITEVESFVPCAMQKPKNGEHSLKRIVLCGDHLQNSPIIQNMAFRQYANFEQSLFLRLVRLGVPTINLDAQGRARPSIAELFKWRYQTLGNLPVVEEPLEYKQANAGFRYEYQFIDVPDYQGVGEREPSPHFIQNLGEAEYAVAIFQYMRLLGYPASKISILTTYAGQRALIKDVLDHRCKGNRLFGLPRIVTTVDKYQGEQNDYIILSLTRTRTVGYLRDVRRLTVALSRARLGLYILGRKSLFETCFELKPAFELLAKRPEKLVLTTGEMYPTSRLLDEEAQGTDMEGLEHLGQYVYEMTQAKIKALGGDSVLATVDEEAEGRYEDEMEGVEAEEIEDDPLHEQVGPG